MQQMIHELPNSYAQDSGSKNDDEYDEEAQPSDGSHGVNMQIHGDGIQQSESVTYHRMSGAQIALAVLMGSREPRNTLRTAT